MTMNYTNKKGNYTLAVNNNTSLTDHEVKMYLIPLFEYDIIGIEENTTLYLREAGVAVCKQGNSIVIVDR